MRFVFDNHPVDFQPGDSILIALLRAGLHPTTGGCLCLAGDCPHCLATVDGISYTRTCRTTARAGMVVERHPKDGLPKLPPATQAPPVDVRHVHCDVAVIGNAELPAEGRRVVTLDSKSGQDVIGIYAGPLVVARTAEGMLHVHPKEIVVATGAIELQPVAPGNHLAGICTARAAEKLKAAGVNLGRTVTITEAPLRFEGTGSVTAVVTREGRVECDTVIVDLGRTPRNGLARMAAGLPVRAVGDAAREPQIPACPQAGVVCPCSGVTVDDLKSVWDRGFHELELVKRATLAGTGPCQGAVCVPHIRSFLADRGGKLQPSFAARPVAFQPIMHEAAAGAYHHPTARTALDAEHRRAGAHMERSAGWWRPWTYADPLQEYWAVREGVSICDIGTLGKFLLDGPDAVELLDRLYPTHVATLKPGRARYTLLLNERGYVIDDGMICRESETRFFLTFTSAGSTHAELWIRDWADAWKLDVRLLNRTVALGAINVTGPLATALLRDAGLAHPPRYLEHKIARVGDIACRIARLSFTGEVSYELHHNAGDSVSLWRTLLALGAKPHGLETLLRLRLEKGHIVAGQDTDFDSTPRRLNHEWAVKLDKPDFVGKAALLRTNQLPLDRQLVALETKGEPPGEGAVLWNGKDYAGYVTSSAWSPALEKSIMLGWLRFFNGSLPEEVMVAGKTARRAATPLYDPEGRRARA
ncbi:MAG: (2Fe-2S)-binding protein [Acidobacteriia bacterium]|nr:(2Fe-2S)-binding protein [Terriglobia bacterium]